MTNEKLKAALEARISETEYCLEMDNDYLEELKTDLTNYDNSIELIEYIEMTIENFSSRIEDKETKLAKLKRKLKEITNEKEND